MKRYRYNPTKLYNPAAWLVLLVMYMIIAGFGYLLYDKSEQEQIERVRQHCQFMGGDVLSNPGGTKQACDDANLPE